MFRKIRYLIRNIFDFVYFYFRGGVAAARRLGVVVGEDCRIYIRSFGTEPFLVTIGNRVTITSGVRIITHDGSTSLVKNSDGVRYQHFARVIIGDDVFIGVNAIILPGVKIHSKSIVAAGAVVTKDVDRGEIVGGNPARRIGSFEDYDGKVRDFFPNNSELLEAKTYRERVLSALDIERKKRLSRESQTSTSN